MHGVPRGDAILGRRRLVVHRVHGVRVRAVLGRGRERLRFVRRGRLPGVDGRVGLHLVRRGQILRRAGGDELLGLPHGHLFGDGRPREWRRLRHLHRGHLCPRRGLDDLRQLPLGPFLGADR